MFYPHDKTTNMRRFSEQGNFSFAPSEIFDLIVIFDDHSKMFVSQVIFMVECFPHPIDVLFFPSNLMSSTYTEKNFFPLYE